MSARSKLIPSLLFVVLVALTACGTRSAVETGASGSADPGPGAVAVAYADALFAGDFSKASSLVEPGSQSAFRLVKLGIDPRVISARNLSDGSTLVKGSSAITTLLGSVCHRQPSSAASAPPAECIDNLDPHSANPIFKVASALQPNGQWLVTLAIPSN